MNQRQLTKEMAKNRNYPERAGRIPENQDRGTVSDYFGELPRGTLTTTRKAINYLKSKPKCLTKSVYNTPPDETKPTWEEIEQAKADAADDWQNEQEVTEPNNYNFPQTNGHSRIFKPELSVILTS